MSITFDVIILGAGAAGLFCGGEIARQGGQVCVIDHAAKPAEKVRISGGGRCNFTNIHTSAKNFLSDNPHFAKSALARYTPSDFCELLRSADISWHEKTLGQLFCDGKSGAIISLLLDRLTDPGGTLKLSTTVQSVSATDDGFLVASSDGPLTCKQLVIATGGLSIPKMGATGFAYDVARQFGHDVITPRPALVPLTFSGQLKDDFAELAGVAAPATALAGDGRFDEAVLFTHRGLSGPAILQASSYWQEGTPLTLDLFPDADALESLKALRQEGGKRTLAAALATKFPRRLADKLCQLLKFPADDRIADMSNASLAQIAAALSKWQITPTGTEGWRTAEVTAGGISTSGLSSRTLESKQQSGLYFIGECVDVTGWLGGYNFQWAWASAVAAAMAISDARN
ncbi:MAG: NAD(P)/FAD-dependent oxidoreductase [Hyphomonadaceae bacterium]